MKNFSDRLKRHLHPTDEDGRDTGQSSQSIPTATSYPQPPTTANNSSFFNPTQPLTGSGHVQHSGAATSSSSSYNPHPRKSFKKQTPAIGPGSYTPNSQPSAAELPSMSQYTGHFQGPPMNQHRLPTQQSAMNQHQTPPMNLYPQHPMNLYQQPLMNQYQQPLMNQHQLPSQKPAMNQHQNPPMNQYPQHLVNQFQQPPTNHKLFTGEPQFGEFRTNDDPIDSANMFDLIDIGLPQSHSPFNSLPHDSSKFVPPKDLSTSSSNIPNTSTDSQYKLSKQGKITYPPIPKTPENPWNSQIPKTPSAPQLPLPSPSETSLAHSMQNKLWKTMHQAIKEAAQIISPPHPTSFPSNSLQEAPNPQLNPYASQLGEVLTSGPSADNPLIYHYFSPAAQLPPQPELPEEPRNDDILGDDKLPDNNGESSEEPNVEPGFVDEVARGLEPLQQFVRDCSSESQNCAQCHRKLAMGVEDVAKTVDVWASTVASTDALIGKNRDIVLGWKCQNSRCTALTCPGCGTGSAFMIAGGQYKAFHMDGMQFKTYWCCDTARLAAIWALCCGYTMSTAKPSPTSHAGQPSQFSQPSHANQPGQYSQSTQSSQSSHVNQPSHTKQAYQTYQTYQPKQHSHPGQPNPVQQAIQAKQAWWDNVAVHLQSDLQSDQSAPFQHALVTPSGVGYGSNFSIPSRESRLAPHAATSPTPTSKVVSAEDNTKREAKLKLLAAILPAYGMETDFDTTPPNMILHMLSRSLAIEQVATMLSSESINEAASRWYGLYDAMLDLFDVMGSHPVTLGLVYNDRDLYHTRDGSLLLVSFGLSKSKARMVPKDTGKPLLALMGGLAAQAQSIVRHASTNPMAFDARDGQKLLKLSQRLMEVSSFHNSNMQRLQTEMDVDTENPKINFSDWHSKNSVSDVQDKSVVDVHYFHTMINQDMRTSSSAQGRLRRIITELSTLRTSLPEGIFIRHGSSRLDAMKVLIIGPKDTPYEYGLFEFDLYCTMQYPEVAPLVRFRTTNGGKCHFNPNLYKDGTVCLSLLGTWSGEPWRAKKSTILQILVSIQSMIFCEHPWYNEPGREWDGNQTMSTKYNNEVRSLTLNYAVLPWINLIAKEEKGKKVIKDPNQEEMSIWHETARLYLLANTRDIMTSYQKAASKSKNSSLRHAVTALGNALKSKGYLPGQEAENRATRGQDIFGRK